MRCPGRLRRRAAPAKARSGSATFTAPASSGRRLTMRPACFQLPSGTTRAGGGGRAGERRVGREGGAADGEGGGAGGVARPAEVLEVDDEDEGGGGGEPRGEG